jgi:hypothetical protein
MGKDGMGKLGMLALKYIVFCHYSRILLFLVIYIVFVCLCKSLQHIGQLDVRHDVRQHISSVLRLLLVSISVSNQVPL